MKITNPTASDITLPTNNLANFLHHLHCVRRNTHPAYRGDGLYNGEHCLFKFALDNPVKAKHFADSIQSLPDSEITALNENFPIVRVRSFAKELIKNLSNQKSLGFDKKYQELSS